MSTNVVSTTTVVYGHDLELKAVSAAIGKINTENDKKWRNQMDFNNRYLITKRRDLDGPALIAGTADDSVPCPR